MFKKIKVFHGVVNYGTQAGYLARGLRIAGIKSISVSRYDPYERIIDFKLKHGGNIFQKIYRHFLNTIFLFTCFFRYDIFHFHYGTSLTGRNWDLPFYSILNKRIVSHYLGRDVQLFKDSVEKYDITNMSFMVNELNADGYDEKLKKALRYRTRYSDLQFVCAPYLSEFVPGSHVLPLAIDLNDYEYEPKNIPDEEILILHAPTSRDNKGTEFIIDAINKLSNEGFSIKLVLVEGRTNKELKEKYRECDIYIDQLLAGWYGFAAVEAMAMGRPVVSFIREEYFQYISYGKDIPIINADPLNFYEVLKSLIKNKEEFLKIGKRSRQFVEKIHDVRLITLDLISHYSNINHLPKSASSYL